MGYKKPTSGNAFADPALKVTGFESPFYPDHRAEINDAVDFRILSLGFEDIAEIPRRNATIANPKNGKPMTITVDDPGAEVAAKIVDHTGTPLSECEITNIFRIPVFVRAIKKGGKTEVVNQHKYLEF